MSCRRVNSEVSVSAVEQGDHSKTSWVHKELSQNESCPILFADQLAAMLCGRYFSEKDGLRQIHKLSAHPGVAEPCHPSYELPGKRLGFLKSAMLLFHTPWAFSKLS